MIASAKRAVPPAVPRRRSPSWRQSCWCCCHCWGSLGAINASNSLAEAPRVSGAPAGPGAQNNAGPKSRRWASANPSVNWGPWPASCSTGLPNPTACSVAVPAIETTTWLLARSWLNWPQQSSSCSPAFSIRTLRTVLKRAGRSYSPAGFPAAPSASCPTHCQPWAWASSRRDSALSSRTRAARMGHGLARGGNFSSICSISLRFSRASGRRLPGSSTRFAPPDAESPAELAADSVLAGSVALAMSSCSMKGLPRNCTGRPSCSVRSLALRASRLNTARKRRLARQAPQGQGSRSRPS